MAAALSRKAVSAPGKVLLAGGYLVLDREHTGLVFGLDARIHVHIEPLQTSQGVVLSEIIVKSPQFLNANWEYGYRLTEGEGGIAVTQLRVSVDDPLLRNPFVETALSYALTYISTSLPHHLIQPASISIIADTDYYSQPAKRSASNSRFLNFDVPLWDAHKTGLGSSAALVTAFTGALLAHYLPKSRFDLTTDTGRQRLHNLSQAAHCAAQGKVGSGFDVASAVYGSCLYKRFSPSILQSHGEPGTPLFSKKLKALVDENGVKWDTEIVKSAVDIPKGLRLVMCDVDCGSKTPGMVKKVLQWRKEKPEEAEKIWSELQKRNDGLAAELVRLSKSNSTEYSELRECIARIRALIREMSEASGVPIEPEEQTQLLDTCSKIPGVVGGVVPGAGGYDAVSLLVENKPDVIESIKKALADWKVNEGVDTGAVTIGKVSMLGVREEMEGVRLEDPTMYGEWVEGH
ncbi:Phosphomevalonate kinase [Lophium mytilinum]|uniref:Phosphomevalonate kinase n=1 Tax=Lophium mytilinum TaxID=390894 RepID=A0A6A6QVZ3_9PEZI|nr:Phosphomevalonate kinase [Lophium mytilinum]